MIHLLRVAELPEGGMADEAQDCDSNNKNTWSKACKRFSNFLKM